MKVVLLPGGISGEISAIPSKSHLHRLLIYAALADRDTLIPCIQSDAADVNATVECLGALGAEIGKNDGGFSVSPIDREKLLFDKNKQIIFPCGESGTTLRFMLPIAAALGINGAFVMEGFLPQRSFTPLETVLEQHGVKLWRDKQNILNCKGLLKAADDYSLEGNVSSQYIAGLLMALPLLHKPSRFVVSTPVESEGYIIMTLKVARAFGHEIKRGLDRRNNLEFSITPGNYKSPGYIEAEGDWFSGAFWMCAGAMPKGNVKVHGLKKESNQHEKEIFGILEKVGANVAWEGDAVRVQENVRHTTEIDGNVTPDLIPILALIAAVGEGTTVFKNVPKKLKESFRLKSTTKVLSALGANIKETPDGLIIKSVKNLFGGEVDSYGDHRIAMVAAIASTASTRSVTITNAGVVSKSYPNFWRDLASLGKKVNIVGKK